MNKKKRSYQPRQSFADFSERLNAKWRLLTMPNRSEQDGITTSVPSNLESIFNYLVSIPTVTGNYEANHDALNYIAAFLEARGMHLTRHTWNNVESLVATTRKTKTPEVMLGAHLDVVPAEQHLFSIREEGDKLYGRGTLDMKFAIAAYLCVIDELRDNLSQYDIGITITTDEEAGGTDGVGRLIEEGYLPKVCVLPDGGDDWQIQLHAKGVLQISLTATGKPAHGSRPWLGKNAIMILAKALEEIEHLFEGHNVATKTFNVGKIKGGKAVNQVADFAEALLDIRVMTEEEKAQVLAAIEKIAVTYGLEVSVVIDGAVMQFKLDNPYIKRFADIVTEVTGTEITGSSTLGSSDARYYAKRAIPCISLYPPGGGHHGPEEWISKKGYHQFKEIVSRFVRTTART
jgi:acetylornithine deacetylase/succinyl-diaminopimelate desuccinylase-like protein